MEQSYQNCQFGHLEKSINSNKSQNMKFSGFLSNGIFLGAVSAIECTRKIKEGLDRLKEGIERDYLSNPCLYLIKYEIGSCLPFIPALIR